MTIRKIVITITRDETANLDCVRMTLEDKFETSEIIGILEWAKVNFINQVKQEGSKRLSEVHFANLSIQDEIKE